MLGALITKSDSSAARRVPWLADVPVFGLLPDLSDVDCVKKRADCIAALPPDELKKLEAKEAKRGAMRREQMRARRGHEVFGGRREPGDRS